VEAGLKVQDSGASSSVMSISEDDIQVVWTGERDAKIDTYRRARPGVSTGMAAIDGINRPFFHVDLTSALKSVVADS
jgi:sodium-independent sulfate anion transporter 11